MTQTPEFIRDIVREWLVNELRTISESAWCAGWVTGLEFYVRGAILALPERINLPERIIDDEGTTPFHLERLGQAAEWLGEWVVWKDGEGETPIPLDEWKELWEQREKRKARN